MPDASAGHPPVGGESKARFEQLYVLYARRLRAYIAARLGSRFHLADDLAQDVWVEAWQCLPRRAGSVVGFGWLASVARRVIARHLQQQRAREVATDFSGPHARLLVQAPGAVEVVMARETTRAVVAVLARTRPLGVVA